MHQIIFWNHKERSEPIMVNYNNQFFHGERPLFGQEHATIVGTTFGKGESPLKESRHIKLNQSIFQYKYPLWYSQHIAVTNTIFEAMARSGIWYTVDIAVSDSEIQAPENFSPESGYSSKKRPFFRCK